MHRNMAALPALAAAALLAALGTAGPARAGVRYDFAVGGGVGARYWQSSQWNPGTCTITTDHNATRTAPQLNQVDGVVFSPGELGMLAQNRTISWGASAQSPAGAKLMVRFVHEGVGCPHSDITITAPAQAVFIPANTRFVVVTAAEGTVQPWFTL